MGAIEYDQSDTVILSQSPTPLRIFLVEDHADTLKFLTLGLQRLGHDVASASSMGEARRMLASGDYDVLLSDIGLPDGDGWTLMDSLGREQPPVAIAMSGFGSEADIARSKAVGFRHHIIKPFKLDKIKALLEESAQELQTHGGH